jgi:hypothetical protein
MRRHDAVGDAAQRAVRGRRLGVRHIQAGIFQLAAAQRLRKRFLVYQGAPGGVDEDGSVLHQRKRAAVDHMAGRIQRGRVQRNHIAFGQQRIQICLFRAHGGDGGFVQQRVIGQHIYAERLQQLDVVGACKATAYHAHGDVEQLGDDAVILHPAAVANLLVESKHVFAGADGKTQRRFRHTVAEDARAADNANAAGIQLVADDTLHAARGVGHKAQVGCAVQNFLIQLRHAPGCNGDIRPGNDLLDGLFFGLVRFVHGHLAPFGQAGHCFFGKQRRAQRRVHQHGNFHRSVSSFSAARCPAGPLAHIIPPPPAGVFTLFLGILYYFFAGVPFAHGVAVY